MTKLIGYARVLTRQQSTDRQQAHLLAAGVRHDDLHVDHGLSGRGRHVRGLFGCCKHCSMVTPC